MAKLWQASDMQRDIRNTNGAKPDERLYERYALPVVSPPFFYLRSDHQEYVVTELSFGGCTVLVPAAHMQHFAPQARKVIELNIGPRQLITTIDVVVAKNTSNHGVESYQVGCRFTYESILALDFLRPILAFLELGAAAGATLANDVNDDQVGINFAAIDAVDYQFELCMAPQHGWVTCLFTSGNTQCAVATSRYDNDVKCWANIGPGAERCLFRELEDRHIIWQAAVVVAGFIGHQPAHAEVVPFFRKLAGAVL